MMVKLRCFCLLICLLTTSGCEIGRSWFQMSSDSPTPFMGFDLLPRRKTTQLIPPQPGGDYPYAQSKPSVQPVSDQRSTILRERVREIQLPHISSLLSKEKEELIAFPEPLGVEGLPE